MRQTNGTRKSPGEKIVKDIKRATRKQYSSEEKIRIVLDGLRGEVSIAELCRREGISQGIYYKWSKDFMQSWRELGAQVKIYMECGVGAPHKLHLQRLESTTKT